MRKIIIAGNWKMNKTISEAKELANAIKSKSGKINKIEIVLCPPFTALTSVKDIITDSDLKLGAQNMYFEKSGAFTGEISGDMLVSAGCEYVIIGHSERRTYFNETDQSINKKIKAAFSLNLTPIVCVGETLTERESDQTFQVIDRQLTNGLNDLQKELIENNKILVIAYEPVWAIGTGKVATPNQAQEVHAHIRAKLTTIFNEKIAQKIQIQYGGSVTPENIAELIKQPDIDGGLIGGASLKPDTFNNLISLCL